jgi:hypothetical protein
MGFLLDLLALPLTGPIKGVMWIAEQVAEQAERELYDPDRVRAKLMELELLYDMGEITEEEYLETEEILLEKMRVIRERERER